MAHELREVYSNLVDEKLRNELVTKDNVIFNDRHDGDPTAGAVKIPVRDTEVAVKEYDRANGGELSQGATAYISLNIDKDLYVNELIDGFEAAAVPDNVIADRLDSAGYSLALDMDKKCINLLETADGAKVDDTKTALTKSTIVTKILNAKTYLSRIGVPAKGRFLIVSPETAAVLLVADEFTKNINIAEDLRVSGSIGKIYGFDVFESTNLAYGSEDETLQKTVTTEFIAGHPAWCHRVRAWKKNVHLQSLDGSGKYIGASAVQGRMVWGAMVSKPQTLFIKRIEA